MDHGSRRFLIVATIPLVPWFGMTKKLGERKRVERQTPGDLVQITQRLDGDGTGDLLADVRAFASPTEAAEAAKRRHDGLVEADASEYLLEVLADGVQWVGAEDEVVGLGYDVAVLGKGVKAISVEALSE
jgi:hypothetical protein